MIVDFAGGQDHFQSSFLQFIYPRSMLVDDEMISLAKLVHFNFCPTIASEIQNCTKSWARLRDGSQLPDPIVTSLPPVYKMYFFIRRKN